MNKNWNIYRIYLFKIFVILFSLFVPYNFLFAQDDLIFEVHQDGLNAYDTVISALNFVDTNPIEEPYVGKLKLAKPYKFFENSPELNKRRVALVAGLQGGLYAAANTWWSTAWYSKTEKSKFHTFNDWGDFNNIDKLGHGMSCYFESKWTYDLFKWSGVKEKHAIWIGMLTGNLWQLSIEVHDGFQKKWGFSWGDMGMNLTGSLLFGIQQYWWHEQRVMMKMSSFPINYTKRYKDTEIKQRADKLFGTSFAETMLKDYNAMTIWFSVTPGSFIKEKKQNFARALQVSFGFGAGGMLGGYENRWSKNDLSGDNILDGTDPADIIDRSDIERYRRYYISMDIDWTKIPVKRKWAKTCLGIINIIKLPFPALEFNTASSHKVRWHWLKF